MFVQAISGQVSDPKEVRAALDRWAEELAPGADGWLGTTAGVSDDGRFVAFARFDSADAARRNSERLEQDQWWAQTAKLFTGEPTFRDSTVVDVDLVGDPDQAGFVQCIEGRSSDPSKSRELMTSNSDAWAAYRPDIIASMGLTYEDGHYTAILYFTSETAAREGEQKEPPPELGADIEAMMVLEVGEPSFVDLRDPWFFSAG